MLKDSSEYQTTLNNHLFYNLKEKKKKKKRLILNYQLKKDKPNPFSNKTIIKPINNGTKNQFKSK